jgi:hypothetical protein
VITNTDLWDAPRPTSSEVGWSASVGYMVFTLLAVDPGETTGLMWIEFEPEDLRTVRFADGGEARYYRELMDMGRIGFREIRCWDLSQDSFLHAEWEVARKIVQGAARIRADRVVSEDFTLRAGTKTRDLLSPVRLVSSMFAELQRVALPVQLHLQDPSIKSNVDDATLKRLGLWFEGMQHSRDAARHAVYYIRRYRDNLLRQTRDNID